MSAAHVVRAGLRGLRPLRVRGPTPERLGLLLCAILVWDLLLLLDGHAPAGWSGALVLATVVGYPLLAVLCAAVLRRPPPALLRRWRPERVLVVAPVVAVLGLALVAVQVPSFVSARSGIGADVTATTVCAAQDVLAGRDPYRTGEADCLHRLRAGVGIATPLQRGPFRGWRRYPAAAALRRASRQALAHHGRSAAFPVYGYPPLSFVWMLPVSRLGPHAWVAWTLAGAALWLLISAIAAGPLWAAVVTCLVLQFGGGSVLGAATQGDGEFFAYALAALALLLLDRPRRSAVLLALAAATNPLAWLVIPGYVALSWRLPRRGLRLGWLGGGLLLAVGPWLLVYRDAAGAIAALVHQPAFAFGIGLVTQLGPAPAPALRTALLAVEAGLLVLLVAASGWRRRLAFVAPALAVAVLWAAWRSDANYLAQLFPLAVATAVGMHRLALAKAAAPGAAGTPHPEPPPAPGRMVGAPP